MTFYQFDEVSRKSIGLRGSLDARLLVLSLGQQLQHSGSAQASWILILPGAGLDFSFHFSLYLNLSVECA